MNRMTLVEEWRRLVNSLRAADVVMRSSYAEHLVSRSYYAVLHAAKSALVMHDFATSSHVAVRIVFGLHLERSGEIERKRARVLAEATVDRLTTDYGVEDCFSSEETQSAYERAKAFLDRVREYLRTKGVTEQELALERSDG